MSPPDCWWAVDALAERPPVDPALREDETADVCIVGGGYAGLWTAIHLKERSPDLDVVVIEQGVCGLGASGRNAGFLMSWWSKFPTLAKTVGDEAALRLCRRTAELVDVIGDFCDREGIDAEYRRSGWLWGATNAAQVGAWQATIDKLAIHGERPFRTLGAAEAAERTGSDAFLGAAVEGTVATVQPAILARGLRDAAIRRGVRIYERTPMTRLASGRPLAVETPGGTVTAPTVVLALNAWIARMRVLRRRLVVISTDALVTEPVGDRLPPAAADGMGVTDARRLLNAFRSTRDGRLFMCRSGGSLTFAGFRPKRDAFQVAKLREAGAVIIGKAALEEYATSGHYSNDPWGQVWNAFHPSKSALASSGGSATALGSDSDFLQLRVQAERVFDVAPKWHVLLRGDVGATAVSSTTGLAPSQRFFAGGDRSVRGFAVNELSPVAPAIANSVASLTGQRLRSLPLLRALSGGTTSGSTSGTSGTSSGTSGGSSSGDTSSHEEEEEEEHDDD